MILDFTANVGLKKEYHKLYIYLRIALYALAALAAIYFIFVIVFPTQYFTFSFLNPNSTGNNIISPRDKDGNFLEHGWVREKNDSFFDAALVGNYSRVKISFALDSKSETPENIELEAKKSYQAFLYPESEKIGFKDGTLIKNKNDFFIVSQGKLRKFANETILNALGYDKNSFLEAKDEELGFNEKGEVLTQTQYPDNALFKIDNEFYMLIEGKIKKFVSRNAFLSQYDEKSAIVKSNDFLKSFTLDENPIGFADGSLISYGISAFIVSSGKILPINNTTTFSAMGYEWKDVIPVSGDELSLYEKDKLFTISSPHPDGTIFSTDEHKWYLVKNGQKHLLPGENIAKSWLKTSPIKASAQSLKSFGNCDAQKETFSLRTYSCEISLENLKNILGKDYEFRLTSANEIKVDNLNISFEKTANQENLRLAIIDIINKVKGNYVAQTPVQ